MTSGSNFVSNTAAQKILFEEAVWQEKLENAYWSRYWSFPKVAESDHIDMDASMDIRESDQEKPVLIKRDLEASQGDTIKWSLILALQGAGIVGSSSQSLKENLESIRAHVYSLELEEYAHGVGDVSPKGRKRVMFNVMNAARNALYGWGINKLDELAFSAIEASPTNIQYPTGVTAVNQLTTADSHKLTMSLLRKCKNIASTRNNGARFKIEPVKVGGKDYYIACCPPDCVTDLLGESEWQSAAQNALARGQENPIFAGADAITVDGIIITSNEKCSVFTNGGAGNNVPYGYVSFFGQKALAVAMGEAPRLEADNDDFNRAKGLGYLMMLKIGKPSFDSKDVGSLQLRVSRTQLQDA